MYAIGIDVGSTNVKAALVASDGNLVADASRPLTTYHSGSAVTQQAEEVWEAVVAAVRAVTAAAPAAAAGVTAIGVCSQYSSVVPIDSDGGAVGPIVTYMDHRGTELCWSILERHPEAFETWVERHGIPPIGAGLSLAHLLQLQDDPEVHGRTAAYLEVMDLVNLRLTGRAVATQCTMFASQLCDNRTVGSTTYDDELVQLAGVDASRLPELVPVDSVIGELTAAAAEALDLPSGVQVLAGMNDTQAGAFATGTAKADAGDCGLMVGTTAVLIRPLPAMAVDLDREVLSMPAPVPGRWIVMAENGIAGRAVERALELLHDAGTTSADRFNLLEGALDSSPAGAGGALFLPWLAGSMSPKSEPDMRGGFLGVSLETSRADLMRATVEGVARNVRWLLPAVEDLAGVRCERILFGGGAARSQGWAQTVADVLGRQVSVLERPEVAAARAVGMVALLRVAGKDPNGAAIPVAASFDPDPAAIEVHDRLQPVFEEAFTAVRGVCEALRS